MYNGPMRKILSVVCRRLGCPVSRVLRGGYKYRRDVWCRAMFVRCGVELFGFERYLLAWYLDKEDQAGSRLWLLSERLWHKEPVFRDVYRQCLEVLRNEIPESHGKAQSKRV